MLVHCKKGFHLGFCSSENELVVRVFLFARNNNDNNNNNNNNNIIIIIGEMRLSASCSALTYSIFVLQTCCFILSQGRNKD